MPDRDGAARGIQPVIWNRQRAMIAMAVEADYRRRTDSRARCDGSGAGSQVAEGARWKVRVFAHSDYARFGIGGAACRPGLYHVCGQGG